MSQKLIIRHLSGSKVNQINKYLIAEFKELTIGRDEDADIRYDPEKDDLVSRRHATIRCEDGNRFIIKDEESRNGTFINKQRIFSEAMTLSHGDIVQFGPGGPEFRFELDPPPKATPPPTREVSSYLHSKQTSESYTGVPPAGYKDADMPALYNQKGRFTLLQDSFTTYKKKTLLTQICIGAGLLGLLILFGGLTYTLIVRFERKTLDVLTDISRNHQTEIAVLETKVDEIATKTTLSMSPQTIGEKFSKAVVKMHLDWKLIHRDTNQQVYHQRFGQGSFPAYLEFDGNIVPWLTTDPENNTNVPISGTDKGTGFSVSRHGLILTNQHVAAGAATSWGIQPHMPYKSYLYRVIKDITNQDKIGYKVLVSDRKVVEGDQLKQLLQIVKGWVPNKEQLLIERRGNNEFIAVNSPGQFLSYDKLQVYFPGNPNPMPGRLSRSSIKHDVALVTVDYPDVIPEVDLEESDKDPVFGEAVTILGYPLISEDRAAGLNKTLNHNPTLITGNMGRRINPAIELVNSLTHLWFFEDMYQISTNIIGESNNGGPVFNSQGRVMGIFFVDFGSDEKRMAFAIPIKYGRELISSYKSIAD
jgi:serine protease Do